MGREAIVKMPIQCRGQIGASERVGTSPESGISGKNVGGCEPVRETGMSVISLAVSVGNYKPGTRKRETRRKRREILVPVGTKIERQLSGRYFSASRTDRRYF